MALADLDSVVVADNEINETSHRTKKLLAEFGPVRGRKLTRLATGIRSDQSEREGQYSFERDVRNILESVADAIADPE